MNIKYDSTNEEWFKIGILIMLSCQINGKLNIEHDVISCNLENEKVWDVYYNHLNDSSYVQLKVLTLEDRAQTDVMDFAISTVQTINSLGLIATIEVYRYSMKPTAYTKDFSFVNVSYRPQTCRRGTKRSYSVDTNTFFTDLKELCIVIVYDENTLSQFLHKYLNNIFTYPLIRYIIVFTSKGFECKSYSNATARILVKLWKKRRILNVISNAPCSCHAEDFYIYRPFRKTGGIGRGLIEVKSKDQILNEHGSLVNQARDLHGTPLKVSLFERRMTLFPIPYQGLAYSPIYLGQNAPKFYGIDGMILQELSKYMNFELLVDDINTYYGAIIDNGSATGSLGKVMRKEVDMAGNSRFIEYYHPDFEYSFPIFTDQLCVVVPKSVKMPTFLAVLLCFDAVSWFGIVLTVLISIFIWNIHKCITDQENGDFLVIYSIFIGVSVKIPKKFRLSILILVCIFSNIIFSNLFQGTLYTHFSKAIYFANIDTLDDLVQSNLTISTTLHIFEDLDSDTYKALRKKVIDTSDKNESAASSVAFDKNTSILEPLSDAKLLVQTKYLDREGYPRLHIARECLRTYFYAYILQSGSPYKYYINHVIVKLNEAGLITKWRSDIVKAIEIDNLNTSFGEKSSTWRMLNNEDIYIAYIVLIIGYFLSFLSFLREIYVK